MLCPNCSSENTVTIMYGKPAENLLIMIQNDQAMLGGCVINPDSPNMHCKDCGHEFIDPHQCG